MNKFYVVHVKQNNYLAPSEIFVHARVLNPVCKRPVPVMTDRVSESYVHEKEIRFFRLASLSQFMQRFVLSISYRLHWNVYYFEMLRRLRPQLIHAHFSGAGEDCLWSAKFLKIPLLINFYGIETNYHVHDPLWLPRYRRIYELSDALICSSNHMKSEMINSGCPEHKINVIRCGVDTDFFAGEVTEWKSGKPLQMLSIARLHPEKGLSTLLNACSLLYQRGFTNWRLSIIGIGPSADELTRLANSLGIARQVQFLGQKSPTEVLDALRAAHIMILPSLKETQGVVLQEAQATSTPVIASHVGGIPEGVLDGKTGFLVQPDAPEALALAIESFIRNPNLLIEMGNAGRAFVERHFSRKVEYQELSRIYHALVHSV